MSATPERILIVDDNHTNLNLLVDNLEKAGYETLVALSGERALRQVERGLPDLILLDVMMPGLGGFETCRRLKENERVREIPIIFMTALVDIDSKVAAFEAGAVDYLTKPLEAQEVLARVATHLTIRRQKQQLVAQQEELATLNMAKDKFFSIISHDLRNAFNGVTAYSSFLEESFAVMERAEVQGIIDDLSRAVQHTVKLLNNLLEWANVQRGRMDFEPELLKLDPFVTDLLMLFGAQATRKEVALTNAVPAGLCLYADMTMTHAVFRNLLSNALKFTPAGGQVTVSACQEEELVEISVADTGIGVGPDHVDGLFDIGHTYTRRGTAGERGTGLGLLLCKELVERQGGRIWAESVLHEGTTISFTLPVAPAHLPQIE